MSASVSWFAMTLSAVRLRWFIPMNLFNLLLSWMGASNLEA